MSCKKKQKTDTIRQRNRRQRNREYIFDYLKSQCCIDCGENNPVVLQFDHIRGKKTQHVSRLASAGSPIKKIQSEIKKCVVRCSNCHAIQTAKMQKWFKDKS